MCPLYIYIYIYIYVAGLAGDIYISSGNFCISGVLAYMKMCLSNAAFKPRKRRRQRSACLWRGVGREGRGGLMYDIWTVCQHINYLKLSTNSCHWTMFILCIVRLNSYCLEFYIYVRQYLNLMYLLNTIL